MSLQFRTRINTPISTDGGDGGGEPTTMGACCYAPSTENPNSDPVEASYYDCLGNNGYFQTIPDGQELEDITCPDLGSLGCCCSCSYVDDFDDYLQNQQTYTGGVRDVTFCECNTLGGVWSEGQLCEDIDVFGLCTDGGGINDDVRIPQACCHDDTCDNVCSVQECADLIVDDPEGTLISFATCNYPVGNHPVAECGTDPAMRRMGERDRLTNIMVATTPPTKKDRDEMYKGKVNQEQNQSCCIYEQNNEVKCSQLTKTQCTIKGGVWGGLDGAGQSVDCDSTIAEHFKNIVQNDGKIDSSYVDGWELGQDIFDGGRFAGVFNSSTNTFGSGSICLGNRKTGIAKDYISESTMNVDPSFSSTKYAVIVSAEDIHQVFDVDAGSGIKQNKIKNASYCDTLRNKRIFSSSIIQRLISVNDSQYVKWSIPSLDCLSFMQRNMLTDEFKRNSIKNQSPRSKFVPMTERYYWSSTPYDMMMYKQTPSRRSRNTPSSSSNIVESTDSIVYSLTSSTSTEGPRINTCCPCVDCLDDCIREIESGGEGSPVHDPSNMKPDPNHTGCDSSATDCGNCDENGNPYIPPPPPARKPQRVPPGGMFDSDCDGVPDCFPGDPNCDQFTSPAQGENDSCDCGPYQISWRGYIHDICGPVGPCSNGDGGYDSSCCEICAPGYGESLCQPCGNNAACCEEKDRKSRKLIDCWRRRYTRNPCGAGIRPPCKCQGSGPTNHPTDPGSGPCFTCQDIARMHNGGPCGHKSNSTKDYWNKIRACMARKCGYTVTVDGTDQEICSYDTTTRLKYTNIESDMEDVVYFYTQLFRETVSDKTESFVKVSPYNIKLHARAVWVIPIK